MTVGKFLRRADEAVQDTKQSVSTVAVVAIAALVVGIVALPAYLRKRKASLAGGAAIEMSESDHAEAQTLLGEREGKA